MLAVVAAAGERGILRDRFVAIFWPESSEDHARQSARQALYSLRQELGREVVRASGMLLSLDPVAITSDVADFKGAIAARDRARAVALSGAEFLEGFSLAGVPTFQRWADEERDRLAVLRTAALIGLASEATARGQTDQAIEWWRQLTEMEPLNGRHAVGYLQALAARGDRAAALAFARKHATLLRREFEVDPDPDVRRLEAELRSMSAPPTASLPAAPPAGGRDPVSERSALVVAGAEPVAPIPPPTDRFLSRRGLQGMVVALVLLVMALAIRQRDWTVRAEGLPVFAVGLMQEVGIPDSARAGRELTDMLATNLARIDGLRVLANSRLLQLAAASADSGAGYADAARRAGATDLLEGELLARPEGLVLELRRVELQTGMVRDAFSVTALDRFRLVDSMTAAVARRFRLPAPESSVVTATTRSPVAYRFYEEGLRAYYQEDHASARRLMHAALAEDSVFAMAAYYEAQLAQGYDDLTPDGRPASMARRRARRLAQRAPDRERLIITANVLIDDVDPAAAAVAESLVARYPDDPASHLTRGRALHSTGDWASAVKAIERAIAIDSAAGEPSQGTCRVCSHLNLLAETYLWFDSLDASVRTAHRHLALRPDGAAPQFHLAVANARRGDSAEAFRWLRRLVARNLTDRAWKLNLELRLEAYEAFERGLPQLMWTSTSLDAAQARWYSLIALRNQGRIREAERLHLTGRIDGPRPLEVGEAPDAFNTAILAMARGDGRAAARTFEGMSPPDSAVWAVGHVARHYAWFRTLAGMAWATAGDTLRVRALADSVEWWGRRSLYGRDRRLHHYLRGLVHVAAKRDEEAVREFREAIHSPSLGFTRVNYELGRALLRLDRPADAIGALQPALRGEMDASNLYITRTELHELLAEAFDRAGRRDSAAVHYQAVVRAWRRADPAFHARRARAAERIAMLGMR